MRRKVLGTSRAKQPPSPFFLKKNLERPVLKNGAMTTQKKTNKRGEQTQRIRPLHGLVGLREAYRISGHPSGRAVLECRIA